MATPGVSQAVNDLGATGATTAQHPSPSQSQNPPTRKRDKAQLSCTFCRRSKLRCDRQQPCSTCSDRSLSSSCEYVQSRRAKSGKDVRSGSPQSSSVNVQDKINQLEGLVVSLIRTMKGDAPPGVNGHAGAAASANIRTMSSSELRTESLDLDHDPQIMDTFGRISLENSETSYVDGGHWKAILDGIAELKDHFEDTTQQPSHPENNTASESGVPELLLGNNRRISKHELLAAVPPRPAVDRLISRFFNTMDMAPVVVHGPTFLDEYELFWMDPSEASVIWLGLLFSMMCIAAQFQRLCGDESMVVSQPQQGSQNLKLEEKLYREKTVQCLVLGNYTTCFPHTLETLILYFTGELFRCEDTQTGTWILLGVIVRLAMRRGYHRDPKHSPQITLFHGEMQRRIWATIVQLDLVISSQIGLPRMIKDGEYDTAEPRNLLDNDFGKGTTDFGPPRADADLSPLVNCNTKNKVLAAFGAIVDQNASTQPCSYNRILQLDQKLREAHAVIPSGLRMRPLAKSVTDQPHVIIWRIYLDLIFHQARCVLHRKYLLLSSSNPQYFYSRQSCIEAALQILHHQSTLNQETQPGGRLCNDRWRLSSLINHDFLLAATILCLALDSGLTTENEQNGSDQSSQRDQIIIALTESYAIFMDTRKSSREAQKVAQAINIILQKVRKSSSTQSLPATSESTEFRNGYGALSTPRGKCYSAAIEQPGLFPVGPPSFATSPQPTGSVSESYGLPTGTSIFDWNLWNSQLQVPFMQSLLEPEDNDLEMFEDTF
ncbi:hypothetical protein DL98DRAFT_661284 [Cadophora sp. DSE1049]|nr:hypothetical protein DL98DRAFT_661284 [Cadophora sp. DSE1049]